MELTQVLGIAAGCCTTISFIPQAYKTLKTKDTSGISLYMYLIFNVGVSLWLVYGIYSAQQPVILANLITLPFTILILILKVKNVLKGEVHG